VCHARGVKIETRTAGKSLVDVDGPDVSQSVIMRFEVNNLQ
jgi:hypothetical protein